MNSGMTEVKGKLGGYATVYTRVQYFDLFPGYCTVKPNP